MFTFNDMVNKYTIRHSNKIRKICEPLQQICGVTHFWYCRTNAEGKFFTVANNPEMHGYYHDAKLYLDSPFFHHPDHIEPGVYSYRNIKDSKFQSSIDRCAASVNVELGVGIVMKSKGEIVRFGYATNPRRNSQFNDLIINNLPLLKKFNAYFISETEELFNPQDELVDLPTFMGSLYNAPNKGMCGTSSLKEKCEFLSQIGLIKYQQLSLISEREKDCLKCMKDSMSAFQTGQELGISNRTVEKYLESIKNKLNCQTKMDLVKIANLLESLGYFDI